MTEKNGYYFGYCGCQALLWQQHRYAHEEGRYGLSKKALRVIKPLKRRWVHSREIAHDTTKAWIIKYAFGVPYIWNKSDTVKVPIKIISNVPRNGRIYGCVLIDDTRLDIVEVCGNYATRKQIRVKDYTIWDVCINDEWLLRQPPAGRYELNHI
jgi:hypothetical protein